MQKTLLGSLLITIGAGLLALPAHAQTTLPTFGYEVSGSCLNSSAGFNGGTFQPNSGGTVWSSSFHGVGSGIPVSPDSFTSNNTEDDIEVVTAIFSAVSGPLTSGPYAQALNQHFQSTLTGPNSDGSSTVTFASIGGTITTGPNKGLTFTASSANLSVKFWLSNSTVSGGISGNVSAGFFHSGGTGSPVIQTVTLSNKTTYARICTVSSATLAPVSEQ